MEEIFKKYQQHFPWLLMPHLRAHLTRFSKSYVSKTFRINHLKDDIAAFDGEQIPQKISKLLISFTKSSLHSKNPSRASEELTFIKNCEKARLNDALDKATQERTQLQVDFLNDLNRSLKRADIPTRPEIFVPDNPPLAARWIEMLNQMRISFITAFELNQAKSDRAKERKKQLFEEKKEKDSEAIVLTKKQLGKMIQDEVKSILAGKGKGRRNTPPSSSGKKITTKSTGARKGKGRSKKTSGKRRN